MSELKTNVLYYGDNLDILRHHIPDESVDLIYLDPPFNSKRSYNVLFKEASGAGSQAQIEAFEDTWHWDGAAPAYEEMMTKGPANVRRILGALVDGLGHNDVTAYLAMMAIRLVELRRVLKSTGSLYLHCDPTAGPYLRVVMDAIFDPRNFRNEIVWQRTEGHSDAKRFGSIHDLLLCYRGGPGTSFKPIRVPYGEAQLKRYKYKDGGGLYRAENLTGAGTSPKRTVEWRGVHPGVNRHWMWSIEEMERLVAEGRILFRRDGKPRKDGLKVYLTQAEGKAVGDVWSDIPRIPNTSSERLGYPTQKPLALLERIINASSGSDDIVLDPFCGCGTAVHAAQKLGRRWIGIDITWLAIALVKRRLEDAFPGIKIEEVGSPTDMVGAKTLAMTKPQQFEYWVINRLDAIPTGGKGPQLDGVKPFIEFGNVIKDAIISVKGTTTVNPEMIREVLGVLDDQHPIGVLVTLAPSTEGMRTVAAGAGFYESAGKKYRKMQLICVEDMLKGVSPDLPTPTPAFAQAAKEVTPKGTQPQLEITAE
jgi:site-specific DNA-methyltransferase (adenine-specific)